MTTLVPVTVQVPQEMNEVRLALVAIVKDLKEGKGLDAVFANMSMLMKAIEGVDKIPTEFKEKLAESVELMGLLGGDLVKVLAAPKMVNPIGQ